MNLTVYLAGEIHSNWREEIKLSGMPVIWLSPNTNHEDSDDCGAIILGEEENPFWRDRKGAGVNSLRTRTMLQQADIVIVKFGDKYRQWNAAFDAGIAVALGKKLIVIHPSGYQHALKEIDAEAAAVCETNQQAIDILRYITQGKLSR